MIDNTALIERIIKRASARLWVAMGPRFTNKFLAGVLNDTTAATKWSRTDSVPSDERLEGVHSSLLSGQSPINAGSLTKAENKLNGSNYDVGEVVMGILESDWLFNYGKSMADKALMGRITLKDVEKKISWKISMETIDLLRKYQKDNQRGVNMDDAGEFSEDMYGQNPFKRPGGWARGWSELFSDMLNTNSSEGRKVRAWMERLVSKLRGAEKVAVENTLEWMKQNPGRKINFTAIGKEMYKPPISRQNVKKAWDKALKSLSSAIQSDDTVQEMMYEHSHQLRAAKVTAHLAQLEERENGTVGVLDLAFTLQGARVASVDLTVDPRVHLAHSPQTLQSILLANADVIAESLPVIPTELVINEKLAHTWGISIENGYPRFSVKVGFRG